MLPLKSIFLALSLTLVAASDHLRRANSFSAQKYPYCQGTTYNISDAHCAKFNFSTTGGSCVEPKNCTTFYDISSFPKGNWSDKVVQFAELITNVFENGDTVMGYAYVEALGDGRGDTCGYIGFTTGTNDANYVVKEYARRSPSNNPFAPFTTELQRLSNLPFCDDRDSRNDTSKLQGYPTVWTNLACKDPAFVRAQLDVGKGMYVTPAMRYAAQWNVTSPLGFALFYDTIIQHGWQYTEASINLPRILELTGPRTSFSSEKAFLHEFLKTRRQLLCCYPDSTWPPSADRVADLQPILADWDKNKNLENPVELKIYGVTVKGNEQIKYDTAECGDGAIPSGWKLPTATAWSLPTSCSN